MVWKLGSYPSIDFLFLHCFEISLTTFLIDDCGNLLDVRRRGGGRVGRDRRGGRGGRRAGGGRKRRKAGGGGRGASDSVALQTKYKGVWCASPLLCLLALKQIITAHFAMKEGV